MRSDKKNLQKKNKIFLFSKILLSFSNYLIYNFSNNPNIKILKTNINGEFTIRFPSNYRIFILIINYIKKKKSIRVPLIYSLPFGYYVKKKGYSFETFKKPHLYIKKL